MGLSLAGLDMTTMYRWRNFDFQRHWKAIAFLPHLLKWEVDFYSQISCASTHQFVQGLVHFKAALSISWLKKFHWTLKFKIMFFNISKNSLKFKDPQITADSMHKTNSTAPWQIMQSMERREIPGQSELWMKLLISWENSLWGSSLKDDLCLLKITGTQCSQLSPLYLTGSSQPIISTSPPSPSSPPIVMPRPCHKDCTFMWRKLRKMQRLKKAIDFL